MPRYAYKIGVANPARLLAADTRPIENDMRCKLALVRLEFEIFQVLDRDRELRSTGQIACRDLVLWPGAADDFGVVPFARALGVGDVCKPAAWSAMSNRDVWVKIVFGDIDASGRNRFATIGKFSPGDYKVVGFRYELSGQWVTTGEAPGYCSETPRMVSGLTANPRLSASSTSTSMCTARTLCVGQKPKPRANGGNAASICSYSVISSAIPPGTTQHGSNSLSKYTSCG